MNQVATSNVDVGLFVRLVSSICRDPRLGVVFARAGYNCILERFLGLIKAASLLIFHSSQHSCLIMNHSLYFAPILKARLTRLVASFISLSLLGLIFDVMSKIIRCCWLLGQLTRDGRSQQYCCSCAALQN